jgi:tetratricopeptide (TPR) repeat protein
MSISARDFLDVLHKRLPVVLGELAAPGIELLFKRFLDSFPLSLFKDCPPGHCPGGACDVALNKDLKSQCGRCRGIIPWLADQRLDKNQDCISFDNVDCAALFDAKEGPLSLLKINIVNPARDLRGVTSPEQINVLDLLSVLRSLGVFEETLGGARWREMGAPGGELEELQYSIGFFCGFGEPGFEVVCAARQLAFIRPVLSFLTWCSGAGVRSSVQLGREVGELINRLRVAEMAESRGPQAQLMLAQAQVSETAMQNNRTWAQLTAAIRHILQPIKDGIAAVMALPSLDGIDPAVIVDAMASLSGFLCMVDEVAEARTYAEQSRKLASRILPRVHPVTAAAINSCADVEKAENRWDRAEALYAEALELNLASMPPGHSCIKACMDGLVQALEVQEKFKELEDLYRRAFRVANTVLPEDHPVALGRARKVAAAMARQRKFDDALGLLKRSLGLARNDPEEAASIQKAIDSLPRVRPRKQAAPALAAAAAAPRPAISEEARAALERELLLLEEEEGEEDEKGGKKNKKKVGGMKKKK